MSKKKVAAIEARRIWSNFDARNHSAFEFQGDHTSVFKPNQNKDLKASTELFYGGKEEKDKKKTK